MLSLDAVEKCYVTLAGQTVLALQKFSLGIGRNEFITVVGPSGCGKTTFLHLLAGIETPTSGTIRHNPEASPLKIGLVFQNNTIFPWRTVQRNLTYPLEMAGVLRRRERKTEAERLCTLIGLDPTIYLSKYPKELSGGETRRVAIGMALAYNANILLLDEPTSLLDYFNKLRMQKIIQSIWLERKITIVQVTHDIDEAIFLGDRVLMLELGTMKGIIEVDLPRPRRPEHLGSAQFSRYRADILQVYKSWDS